MATAGDWRLRKKPFRPVVKLMKSQLLQCFGHVKLKNSTRVSDHGENSGASMAMGMSTFTRSMEILPNDVLLNIFTRLFAKQVAQMRCVSKSWNTLLSQSSFIKSHLNRSRQTNDQILLTFHDYEPPCDTLPFKDSRATIMGSVNGLICFSYNDSPDIHIWNPSLSAMLTLPPTTLPAAHGGYKSIRSYFHFGFDPKTDDYKVVKLSGVSHVVKHSSSSFIDEWLQAQVYSTRKGSWELIAQRVPSEIKSVDDQYHARVHALDGHCHWLGLSLKARGEVIVAFDLGLSAFRVIPLPFSYIEYSIVANVIGVLAGKLCVISRVLGRPYEVWVMDEYGSWVKRHVFSLPVFGHFALFGITSRGELLFEDTNNECRLISFHRIADITVDYFGLLIGNQVAYVVEYLDSLVWPHV